MEARFRRTGAVALVLVLLGITVPASYAWWLNTRTFVALETPVSLAPGKFSSGEFEVNLEGWYEIGTDVDQSFPFRVDCGFDGQPPLLKTQVSIYQDGKLVQSSEGADRFLGHFLAEPGKRYRFDLEVLTDASCLSTGHPRIFVWTESSRYRYLQDIIWVASALLFLFGIGVFFFSVSRALDDREQESEPSPSKSAGAAYRPQRRVRLLKPRFRQIPHFGLIFSVILAVLLVPAFLIYLYAWGYDYPSSGIHVHLIRPGPPISPGFDPPEVLLHVECLGLDTPTRFYLNSRLVQVDALPGALKLELKSRADWVVYVKGDPDCTWETVADAIDIDRTAGAQVVLLTSVPPNAARPAH